MNVQHDVVKYLEHVKLCILDNIAVSTKYDYANQAACHASCEKNPKNRMYELSKLCAWFGQRGVNFTCMRQRIQVGG